MIIKFQIWVLLFHELFKVFFGKQNAFVGFSHIFDEGLEVKYGVPNEVISLKNVPVVKNTYLSQI